MINFLYTVTVLQQSRKIASGTRSCLHKELAFLTNLTDD